MDFKQIEAFVYVAKYKSFSRAAEKLLLSQPTISTHISTLEEQLGVKLFDRLSKEVILTEAGQVFYPYAVDILDLRERSQEAIKEFLNEISGHLHIGYSTVPAEFILPEVIRKFKEEYPKTFFTLDINGTQNVVQRLSDGILDLAIVARKIPKKDLEYKVLLRDKIVLIVHKNHKFYDRASVFLEEILQESFIIREMGSGTRAAVEHAFKQKGYDFESLDAVAMLSSTYSIKHAVKRQLGIAFMSQMALSEDECGGGIKAIPITDLVVEKEIYVVYSKKRTNKKLMKHFIDTLLKHARE
ncbi:selenium metabolism-associated LysR family transcriptional regulator [Geovibrio ferrireducens]|jgi:DNA-binding transcriptional LysR family regulator|uniref:selenium metabolism-associated LysR family transcriptional regulator n=1 Tax=Geovibrio ferrireducens TaxID=46201 RepID=UPI00224690B4|nr:selenium metabolism-associated LysR family transcriptional regulator [Geovibrio ferrireducens]